MSDKLENFIRNNREAFDTQTPNSQVWQNIQTSITQNAAAGASSSGASAAAGKAGAAKIAAAWKISAIAFFVAAVGVGLYFFSTADGNLPEKNATTTNNTENAITAQVERQDVNLNKVLPPIQGADIPYLTFEIDAASGKNLKLDNGTQIEVPAHVFVDAEGKPVSGKVKLKYREFHDAADILLSGIPMVYNNNGKFEDFQTAGMLDIQGEKDGKPVFIAEGKTINIRMASFTDEDDYGLYYLDPQSGWKDIGKAKIEPNKDKDANSGQRSDIALGTNSVRSKGELTDSAMAAPIAMQKPQPPVKGVANKPIENEVAFGGSYNEFAELKPFSKVRWQAAEPAEFKKSEALLVSRVWNDIRLVELDPDGLLYKILLRNQKKESLSIKVRPVLEGEDYEKAMEKFKLKKQSYDKLLVQRKSEDKRLLGQANLLRSFAISGFGIYNCDRFYGNPDVITCIPEYKFNEDAYMDLSKTIIYHITADNRALLKVSPLGDLKFSPQERNFLVMLMPGNTIAYFGPEDFQKLDIQGYKSSRKAMGGAAPNSQFASDAPKFVIEFHNNDQVVKSASDLRGILKM